MGTLYSNESEFAESRGSLLKQENCFVTQYLIKDLREYDAHNLLWKLFNHRACSYDLIVKVDADTILKRNNIFQDVYTKLQEKKLDGVQLSLFDYFSQSSINGMGFFLPHVKFTPSKSRLFADRAVNRKVFNIGKNQNIGIDEDIGFHCRYPSVEQSYRYGFHRWRKKQYGLMGSVIENWIREQDTARGWALVGAINSQKRRWASVDYGTKHFQKLRDEINSDNNLENWIKANLSYLNIKI